MPEARAKRILLADDHALIRDALPRAIRRTVPEAVFFSVATAPEVVAAVERDTWDLLVLDLGLPGGGELVTLRRLRTMRPELPILVLTMFAEEKMGAAAIAAGANGYLCKTADRGVIAQAAAETLAGRGYLTDNLRRLLATRNAQPKMEVASLSRREFEVLVEIARGRSNKEIAADMDISVTSVGTYRTRIMEKLALRTNADLVRFVVEKGLARS